MVPLPGGARGGFMEFKRISVSLTTNYKYNRNVFGNY
jgi:hypothetical protein